MMVKYNTIEMDPPWPYRDKNIGWRGEEGAALKYPLMSLEELKALPISNVSNKDSVLFLWVTIPFLPQGPKVLECYGYSYKTSIIWRKIMSHGMGWWFRGQCEICLVGIKGKVKAFHAQKSNFIQTKVRKHSQKPEEFYELIEPFCGIPRLELFASTKRDGWDSVGFDCNNQDVRDFLQTGILRNE